jgi:predicted dehydrogenase/threonine dehydrogenase-like Zn-dependent dehydrogenase
VLVRTAFSLISAGTERMKVQQAQMSLAGKARARPDQVTQVLEAVTRDGIAATCRKVMNRLKTPVPLGYSLSGTVIKVAGDVAEFKAGDRVACAGSTANHAEFVVVPKNLCCPVPDPVPLDMAACTTVGAIALQGVRQAAPQLGDFVAVVGLGLVGQFCVQLLAACGCRVFGLDLEAARLELAKSLGADAVAFSEKASAMRQIENLTGGIGADIVILTASSGSPEPVHLAGALARDRARIVDIGKTKLDLPWEVFYEKELDLRMSRSYGPGRYDPSYEEKGNDYPVGYVRWTEKHNMEMFLELLAKNKVRAGELIQKRFEIADSESAYHLLLEDKSVLGILLEYDGGETRPQTKLSLVNTPRSAKAQVVLGVVGAGNHCKSMLLPALQKEPSVQLAGICAATGLSAADTGKRFGFQYATSDAAEVLNDAAIDSVLIATRHNLHGPLALAALRQGKAVYVEKPLTLSQQDLPEFEALGLRGDSALMVGYNRRFAPLVVDLKQWMGDQPGSWIATYRVNAGRLPASHWQQDPVQGGGRLLSEVCHFVDLFCYLFGAHPVQSSAVSAAPFGGRPSREEHAVYRLLFPNGSLAQIVYTSEGDSSVGKEDLELLGNGSIARFENFQKLTLIRNRKKATKRVLVPDKGHRQCLQAFLRAVKTGTPMPIPMADLLAVSRTCFELKASLQDASLG